MNGAGTMASPAVPAPPPVRGPHRGPRGEVDAIPVQARVVAAAPLHVAVALSGTDAGRSGIGTCVRELLPPLIDAVRAEGGCVTAFGHAADLRAFAAVLGQARVKPIRLLPHAPGPNAAWHLLRAGRLASRLGADVLLLPAANRRIASSPTLPTVAVVHDLAQLRVDRKYDRLRLFYFRRMLLPAFRRATRLVAVSGATRDDLVQTLGIPPERIDVVHNGVNTRIFRQLDPGSDRVRAVRTAVDLADRPYLLYPSRLEHPGKNHVRLLQGFAGSGLRTTHRLALCGADWGARPLIEATIRSLGLEDAVRLLGFVSADDLPVLVAGADAVLMLGLHEGFGLPPLEALSAGRPVCVANTGALPEVVGEFGVQCDPLSEDAIAEALHRVVSDEPMRAHCAAAGPAWADHFTWERAARGILAACHEAVGA